MTFRMSNTDVYMMAGPFLPFCLLVEWGGRGKLMTSSCCEALQFFEGLLYAVLLASSFLVGIVLYVPYIAIGIAGLFMFGVCYNVWVAVRKLLFAVKKLFFLA